MSLAGNIIRIIENEGNINKSSPCDLKNMTKKGVSEKDILTIFFSLDDKYKKNKLSLLNAYIEMIADLPKDEISSIVNAANQLKRKKVVSGEEIMLLWSQIKEKLEYMYNDNDWLRKSKERERLVWFYSAINKVTNDCKDT